MLGARRPLCPTELSSLTKAPDGPAWTSAPAAAERLRGPFGDLICLGGVNPPGIKVLPGGKTLGRRKSAGAWRKEAFMPNGIIVIDKPVGWTSMDVCAKLRGVLREKRVGHAGTLDPMATGVLPVFVGRATRAVEFASEGGKEYVAGLRLGVVTDTQDTTGNVQEERPVRVTREELEAALDRFRGEILQVPPMYSAVKIGGKKLYELARKGKEVERKARSVTIYELELLEGTEERPAGAGGDGCADWKLRVKCSKGTYVRTLCHDIGQALGCGGCMSALRRTEAAGFTLAQALTLEEVVAAGERGGAESLLLPVDAYFARYPELRVGGGAEKKLRNGMAVPAPCGDGTFRVYGEGGAFLGLGGAKDGSLRFIKSFFEVS